MIQVPKSWSVALLGAVASVEMGQSPDSRFYNDHGEGLPFFQGKAEFGSLHPATRKWCSAPKKIANRGDILLSIRAPVGPTNVAAEKCCIGRGLAAVRAHDLISQSYLLRFFRNLQPWLSEQGTGTTFAAISGEFLRTIEVPIAPRNEQTCIADKLDAVLARVDACRDRLDRIPVILKRFRQSVLAAATSGKLSEDWRNSEAGSKEPASACEQRVEPRRGSPIADIALPSSWRWAIFGEFVSSFRSGTSIVPQDDLTQLPVLRSSSVRHGRVDYSDVRFLPGDARLRRDDLLADGDLLFTRLSGSLEYVANCALVQGLGDRQIYFPDRLFRAKLVSTADAQYLEICFGSPRLRSFLEVEAKSSAGHQRISMGAVTEFPIPLPPIAEQAEIVRRVESLFAYADRLEARYSAARAQVEKLTPATLAKAFRGELVPQDPKDEAASVLLERIRGGGRAHPLATQK